MKQKMAASACVHPPLDHNGTHRNSLFILADVDISPNPNPFNLRTAEYEYIKKTGIRINKSLTLVLKLWHSENISIWSESLWIHLWPRIRIHFNFCHRIRIQLPGERCGPQPTALYEGSEVESLTMMSWLSFLSLDSRVQMSYSGLHVWAQTFDLRQFSLILPLGLFTWKMYTPARTAPQNPYPLWHYNWPKWYPRCPSICILTSMGVPPWILLMPLHIIVLCIIR